MCLLSRGRAECCSARRLSCSARCLDEWERGQAGNTPDGRPTKVDVEVGVATADRHEAVLLNLRVPGAEKSREFS